MNGALHVSPGQGDSPFDDCTQQENAANFGMWVFLATELVFFGPLFLAYCYGRLHWGHDFALASRHTDVLLGTINTALLLSSSTLVALAAVAAKSGTHGLMRRLLWATVVLGAIFLAIKGVEYHADWRDHLVPGKGFQLLGASTSGGELFFFLYFVMTGLHAIHMIVGMSLLSIFAVRARSHAHFSAPHRIEIAALYWHFVDVVWIFLYPLLYLVERHT